MANISVLYDFCYVFSKILGRNSLSFPAFENVAQTNVVIPPNQVDIADFFSVKCPLNVSSLFFDQLSNSRLSSDSFELRANQLPEFLGIKL